MKEEEGREQKIQTGLCNAPIKDSWEMGVKAISQLGSSKHLAAGPGWKAIEHVVDILVKGLGVLLGIVR